MDVITYPCWAKGARVPVDMIVTYHFWNINMSRRKGLNIWAMNGWFMYFHWVLFNKQYGIQLRKWWQWKYMCCQTLQRKSANHVTTRHITKTINDDKCNEITGVFLTFFIAWVLVIVVLKLILIFYSHSHHSTRLNIDPDFTWVTHLSWDMIDHSLTVLNNERSRGLLCWVIYDKSQTNNTSRAKIDEVVDAFIVNLNTSRFWTNGGYLRTTNLNVFSS